MELFTALELWQQLLLIPVILGVGAAVIFALFWVFAVIFVIAFKIAVLFAIAALLFGFIYLSQGGTF